MSTKTVILLIIVALFAGAAVAKIVGTPRTDTAADAGSTRPSLVRADPTTVYEEALEAGKPILVYFHSDSCQACAELSAAIDVAVPEYEGRLSFVNAFTNDPAGRQFAELFSFQFIPTSFFLSPDGEVLDFHTGVLTEEELRQRLDDLVAQ